MQEINGLTNEDAAAKLKSEGYNEVPEAPFSLSKQILKRLWEPNAWILEAALFVEIILGKWFQAAFIVVLLLFAATNGAFQARKAHRNLSSLSQDLTIKVSVLRSGKWISVPSRELVLGDVVNLQQGNIIPADMKILQGSLETNESSITGEANSISHHEGDLIYSGTEILSGQALATVSAVGLNSRAGKTTSLLKNTTAPGHLQTLLSKIIGYLALIDVILTVIILGVALIRHQDILSLIPFIAMLFISTIPITMPSSFSVANSIEAKILSTKNILVSDLAGIQDAANLNVLLSDKTGTITNNRPEVVEFHNYSKFSDSDVLALANAATNPRQPSVVDKAVQAYVLNKKIDTSKLQIKEVTDFDPKFGYSKAVVSTDQGEQDACLGSFSILAKKTNFTQETNANMGAGRSVAVSLGDQLVGLFILEDQPRSDSPAAIKAIKDRGVRVIMITGDNQVTAQTVAAEVNLEGKIVSYDDFIKMDSFEGIAGVAEVLPEHKLAIVKKFQQAGYIVGMTGDGVNDAPALKQAEVGIAVNNAVDLAKRSARFILMTPGLGSIVEILDSGHRVYQRMMTWTITKLARAAELMILLTLGFLTWGVEPLTLNAMILLTLFNNLVTIVLGTDRTTITYHPETWDLKRLNKLAGVFAIGWSAIGYALMWYVNDLYPHQTEKNSTIIYLFLILSALMMILMTRTKKPVWRDYPSKWVAVAISGDMIVSFILAYFGIMIAKVSLGWMAAVLLGVIVFGTILDLFKLLFYKVEKVG
ncbi:HAD-IC family P-type ATPase [Xylocopilactobacillus apicola]|uniref:Proton-efflux P-type ATPase n=1 Tax=Xylocopilactobacillus apicola TaxID=2932184 RepID=A0AAU9DEM7_9LACO|nr:HAD-IC family P-type ATPase [Xylocopilactobacillus apicola]BDR59342.1 proton-efflux P-type ATPase [Xylocopilactobacillus apicola]